MSLWHHPGIGTFWPVKWGYRKLGLPARALCAFPAAALRLRRLAGRRRTDFIELATGGLSEGPRPCSLMNECHQYA
jgi:hypothetical protein